MPRGRRKGLGKPPGSGRKKGTLNKSTLIKLQMLELMNDLDCSDPMSFFTSILKSPNSPYDHKLIAARELLPYAHPKLSSIEGRVSSTSHEERLAQLQAMIEDHSDTEEGGSREG